MSSEPLNSMPEHAEAEAAPGEVLDQTAPPAEPSPAEVPPAERAGQERPVEASGIPGRAAEGGGGVAETGGPAPESLTAESPTPPGLPEVTPAEVPTEAAQAGETAPGGEEVVGDSAPSGKSPETPALAASEPAVAGHPPAALSPPNSDRMDWYILKVQSNREESIREGLRRRIAVAGYEHYFGDIIIPMEKVTEVKAGKKRTYKRKLYPGYLMVQMEINEDTWFLVRETPGIGDFTGAGGHPTPMNPREVQAILAKQEEKPDQQEKVKINFRIGDRVKIKEGTFESFEGEVSSIDETNGRVTVLINIFGRSTPVDIEYWQIEAV